MNYFIVILTTICVICRTKEYLFIHLNIIIWFLKTILAYSYIALYHLNATRSAISFCQQNTHFADILIFQTQARIGVVRRKAAVDEERGIAGKEKRAEGFLSGTLEDGRRVWLRKYGHRIVMTA